MQESKNKSNSTQQSVKKNKSKSEQKGFNNKKKRTRHQIIKTRTIIMNRVSHSLLRVY